MYSFNITQYYLSVYNNIICPKNTLILNAFIPLGHKFLYAFTKTFWFAYKLCIFPDTFWLEEYYRHSVDRNDSFWMLKPVAREVSFKRQETFKKLISLE
jgi:hypothetical protein